jgi:hypothetical protein
LIFGPTSAYEALTTAPVATKLEIPQFAVSLLPAVAEVSPWSFIGGVDARKLTADLAKFGIAKLPVPLSPLFRPAIARLRFKTADALFAF